MKNETMSSPAENEPASPETTSLSRRGFMWTSALAAAGAGAAGLFKPSRAEGAPGVEKTTYGQGPFPTEGMALYASQGPHKPMKLERRALGPKDVAIKLHYCGICHSDIHVGKARAHHEVHRLPAGAERADVRERSHS